MSDDVVSELDAVLEKDGEYAYSGPVGILKRARDEIVALRRYKHENHEAMEVIGRAAELIKTQKVGALSEAKRLIRDEALEEAATACVGSGAIVAEARLCASAIRALKEKLA